METFKNIFTNTKEYTIHKKNTFLQWYNQKISPKPPYSINLMWLNNELDKDRNYVYHSNDLEVVQENLIKPIMQWAEKNPRAHINFWYDSKLTTYKALNNTRQLITQNTQNGVYPPITFCDIQKLKKIAQNPEAFSDDTPVFWRADLADVIAGVETVKKNKKPFISSDLDVQPINEAEMFSCSTMRNLKKFGTVMNGNGNYYYENQFHITTNYNKNLLKALNFALIKLSLEQYKQNNITPQCVYYNYQPMFRYLYHLENWHKLSTKDGQLYDKKIHGLAPLLEEKSWTIQDRRTIAIPTKKMTVPKSQGNYDGRTYTANREDRALLKEICDE